MPESFARRVRAALLAASQADVREGHEAYFKGAVRFHGVRAPEVRALARRLWPGIASRGDAAVTSEAFALLEAPYFEEKQIGVALLGRLARRLPARLLDTLAPVFDRAVHDWATCDDLSGHVLRPMIVRDPAARRVLLRWSRNRNAWRQRASAVAWANEARHGEFTDEILVIAANVVRNPERFAQLGAGWVLREVSLTDPPRVPAFLAEHRVRMTREALRYAVEKLPADLRARVLAEPPAARRPARAGRPPRAGSRAADGRRPAGR